MSPTDVARRPAHDLLANRHADVELVEARSMGAKRRRTLGRSLATFQVGESGTGEHLFAAAEAVGATPDYLADLRAFIAEEQEHARLLALVLDAIDQPLLDGHWTDALFTAIRRIKSLRAEVLTLLVAEVIAIPYYAALRDGIGDPELSVVFARIHADELRHVTFHAETLPAYLHQLRPHNQLIARLGWNTLVAGAGIVVAVDHGRALRAVGKRRRDFVREVTRVRSDLDRRLFA